LGKETIMETIFENSNVSVSFDGEVIRWNDLKDKHNDYKGFTQNKRGIKKAVEFIKQHQEILKCSDFRMGDVTQLMTEHKLNPHTYCGMD